MHDDSNARNPHNPQLGEIARTIADTRAAAHAVLVKSRRSRLAIAQQTREALRAHRAQIRGAVKGICLGARGAFAGNHAVVDREIEPTIPGGEDAKWDFTLDSEVALPITKNDVIRVIEKHPEGVSLTEIGNELGADWRGLVNWSHRLVIDGKVEKFDDLFYPPRE